MGCCCQQILNAFLYTPTVRSHYSDCSSMTDLGLRSVITLECIWHGSNTLLGVQICEQRQFPTLEVQRVSEKNERTKRRTKESLRTCCEWEFAQSKLLIIYRTSYQLHVRISQLQILNSMALSYQYGRRSRRLLA